MYGVSFLATGLIILAILGAFGTLVGYERKAGADKVRAELQPKLTACESLNATLGAQIKQQNAAVEALAAEGAKKQAASAAAVKVAEGRAKVWTDNATKLQAALTARKPDGPKDCKAAWTTIREGK